MNIVESYKQISDKIRLIADNMIALREKHDVEYRPYRKPFFVNRGLRKEVKVNLKEFFGEYSEGDCAYVSISLLCQKPSNVSLLTDGACEVWLNGICYGKDEFEEWYGDQIHTEVYLKEGYNEVIFKCVAQKDKFELRYTFGYVFWPDLWTCDYMLWVRDCIPLPEYEGEQGLMISELIKRDEEKSFDECKMIYPPESEDDRIIDLNNLYGNEKGDYAISLSYAKSCGKLDIVSKSEEIKIYINGFEAELNDAVSGGDEIIIISKRGENGWGFESKINNILNLPFVISKRKNRLHWIHIGAFKNRDLKKIQFKDVYENANNKPTFWRFSKSDTYLRPYLDTSFYGQWFYGLMIGEYGLLRASQHGSEYYSYFEESMSILAEYFRYMKYDADMFGTSTFLKRSVNCEDLDSIGTIGMNLYELYIRTENDQKKKVIRYVLNNLAESIYTNIPRMEDGTFYRISTLWSDDTYMSCPFLVRMGNLTGETKYYDEVITQLKNYTKKLYLPEINVFAHIYFPTEKRNNNVPWGRGNGWVYLSFAEVIEHLPKGYAGRDELIDIFKKAVEGLVKLQDENGMWHQVLNMPESYYETSCTALFSVAAAKGIRLGILDKEKYTEIIKRAVDGLLNISVDESGNVGGVCRGSGCNDSPEYYASLKTILNDDHGTGVVMAALCELAELIK